MAPQTERAPERRRGMRKHMRVLGLGMAATILVAACSGSTATQAPASAAPASEAPASSGASEAPASASPAAEAATVRLQLQWAPQAQFAGYFAAEEQGYFAERGPRPSTSSTAARRSSRSRSARRRTGPSSRSRGSRRSSRRARRAPTWSTSPRSSSAPARCRSSWKDSGIADICDSAGKKVGVWDFGNEYEVTAGLSLNCGLTPGLENNGDPATETRRSPSCSTWSRS